MTPEPTVVRRSTAIPYLLTVAFMALLTVTAALMIIFLRPEKENATLIASVTGSLTATTAAILAIMKAQETHLSVNSRLDSFMATAKSSAYDKGVRDTNATIGVAVAAIAPAIITAPVVAVPINQHEQLRDRIVALEAQIGNQQANRIEKTGYDTNERVKTVESKIDTKPGR